jgi:hypothetical protein
MRDSYNNLLDLTRTVASDGPELTDVWEATALIESFGLSDRLVEKEFGLEDTRAVGEYIYASLQGQPAPSVPSPGEAQTRGVAELAGKFFSSFVYSIPWMVVLFFEWTKPKALEIAPDIGGPLSLALMGSLITSGGFIQLIARRGRFYLCLQEPSLARRVCMYFLRSGFITSSLFCLIALFAGYYFNLFSIRGLLVAAPYYLLLNLLWMACAVLSTQGNGWRIPVVFMAGGVAFTTLKSLLGAGALAAQMAAAAVALTTAASLAVYGFRSQPQKASKAQGRKGREMELPRVPVLSYLLAPYFVYGVAYFSFLFADRIAAGTAISWFSGLSFGIEPGYAQGMNLALANFLFIAALVEVLNYKFMQSWYDHAKTQPNAGPSLRKILRHHYAWYTSAIVGCFVVFGTSTLFFLVRLQFFPNTKLTFTATFLGSLGYLLLAVGLFNAVVLFSVNRPGVVLRPILLGLLADFLVSYILSHLLGTYFAVTGLVLGGTIFAVGSTRAVLRALEEADYTYYAA